MPKFWTNVLFLLSNIPQTHSELHSAMSVPIYYADTGCNFHAGTKRFHLYAIIVSGHIRNANLRIFSKCFKVVICWRPSYNIHHRRLLAESWV